MCGIVGQLNFDNSPVSPLILRRMTDAIVHRGQMVKVTGLMEMWA